MPILKSPQISGASNASFYPYQIGQSLMFDGTTSYLSLNPSSGTTENIYSVSMYIKRCELSTTQVILSGGKDADRSTISFDTNDKIEIAHKDSGTDTYKLTTDAVFRDTNAWYNIVLIYNTDLGTSTDRIKLYVNGNLQSLSGTYPASGKATYINAWFFYGSTTIGRHPSISQDYFNGYMSHIQFFYNTELSVSDFGELKEGVWVPKNYSASLNSKDFYLKFENSSNIGNDSTTNNNDFSEIGITASNVVLDSPTNNYATINSLWRIGATGTLSNGNLRFDTSGADEGRRVSSIGVTSGKWYWETTIEDGASTSSINVGIITSNDMSSVSSTDLIGIGANSVCIRFGANNGEVWSNGSLLVDTGFTYAVNDRVNIAFDRDTGKIWFGRNGVWYNSGNPTTGSNPTTTLTMIDDEFYFPAFSDATTSSGITVLANFGQLGFDDTQPSSFLSLNTNNLPTPVIGPEGESNTLAEDHFNVKLWVGNGTSQTISDVPVGAHWIKNRSQADYWRIQDVIRGTTAVLISNENNAEVSSSNSITAFNSNSYDIGNNVNINTNNENYVSYNWELSNKGVLNNDGTIPTIVAANSIAGHCIITFTGTGSSESLGHGLNKSPMLMIAKNRTDAAWWPVQSPLFYSSDHRLFFNSNTTIGTDSAMTTTYTDSVINIDTDNDYNGNTDGIVIQAMHSVEGFSKVGLYKGNGSSDGTFVFCGFKPRFVLIKRIDNAVSGWRLYDTVRDEYEDTTSFILYPDSATAENNSTIDVDISSSGFKCRINDQHLNANGHTYLYYAIAETPFKYTNAR